MTTKVIAFCGDKTTLAVNNPKQHKATRSPCVKVNKAKELLFSEGYLQ